MNFAMGHVNSVFYLADIKVKCFGELIIIIVIIIDTYKAQYPLIAESAVQ